MQWADINNIILPLFMTTATPLEKERDTTLKVAQDHVIEYCKDLPLRKHPDSSYLCRLQIESDCIESQKRNACDLLVKLRDWENKVRGHQIAIVNKKEKEREREPEMFWCKVFPEEWPVSRGPAGKSPSDELKELKKKIAETTIPVSCENDSQCRMIEVGKKPCGGYYSAIYYSILSGDPSFLADIKRSNQLEDKHNQESGRMSDCSVTEIKPPACINKVCKGKE